MAAKISTNIPYDKLETMVRREDVMRTADVRLRQALFGSYHSSSQLEYIERSCCSLRVPRYKSRHNLENRFDWCCQTRRYTLNVCECMFHQLSPNYCHAPTIT